MKVLLFANIGTDKQGFYHVGDEAMFQGAYDFYKQYLPDFKLSTLVSAPLYTKQITHEEIGLTWPQNIWSARIYFAKLLFKTFLWRRLNISLFSREQKILVENIYSQDLIHLVGGGYLTSECGGWMYYGLLILALSHQLNIRTVMTSQTIGPFDNMVDRYLAARAINTAEFVMLRTKSNEQMIDLRKMGVTKPKITSSLDSAYFLKPKLPSKLNLSKPSDTLRIGLSLHAIEGKSLVLKQIIHQMTEGTKTNLEILLLPHVVHKQIPWDLSHMEEVVADLPPSIRIITPDYYSHTPLSELSQVMKGLTSTCDLVVSSRYHGVIFALSESVPTLAIVGNTYQHMKNSEALKFVFGSKWKQYLIDLRDQAAVSDALSAWTEILANKSAISKHVRSKNIKLHNEYDTYLATLKSVIVGDRQLLS